MYTVPNQKIIHIHRAKLKDTQFLQIRKDHWYAANKDLTPYGLQLYLYLAGNKEGYDLALSQVDAEEAGIAKTTFHKYVKILIEKGYLVPRGEGSNIYDFYETPYRDGLSNKVTPDELISLLDEMDSSPDEQLDSPSDREIYNTINKGKNNNIYIEKIKNKDEGFVF